LAPGEKAFLPVPVDGFFNAQSAKGAKELYCLIAAEESISGMIRANLKKMNNFSDWTIETCAAASSLNEWSGKNIDVLVLSRFLQGADPIKLLSRIRPLFPSAHIVLLIGQLTESSRAYMRAASKAGLHNIVTGKLPGDRPYNLMTALTRPKRPEIDGYNELGDEKLTEREQDQTPDREADHEDLERVVQQPVEAHSAREDVQQKYPVKKTNTGVLVVSTANKGGVGKTTTAIATATALGRAGIPAVLVDLDLGAPDLATFFKIRDVPGIESLSNLHNINPGQIDRLLVNVENNLYILPGPMNRTLPRFEDGELSLVLDYLKGKFPVVVCDTPPEPWTKRWLYSIFDTVDMALAVVDQSKFSEEETKKYAPTLLAMGIRPERIRIVVNRFSPKLHNTRVIETMFRSGFKKTCPIEMLPRIGAVIQDNWDASVIDTYKGEIAGLEAAGSQWHKLAKEIADLAGYRNESANTGNGPNKDKNSLLYRLLKKGWSKDVRGRSDQKDQADVGVSR
jgi:cellulose biosynthesis protein BcsQ